MMKLSSERKKSHKLKSNIMQCPECKSTHINKKKKKKGKQNYICIKGKRQFIDK